MRRPELKAKLSSGEVNKVKFAVTDIDGILRGKLLSTRKILKALESDIGFCNVIFGWDMNDVVYDNTDVSGWHTGYADAKATLDIATYREIPWDDNCPLLLGDFSNSGDPVHNVCPRTLLKKIVDEASDMGFKAVFSNEFEWFNFKETPHTLIEKGFNDLKPLTPGMFGYSILRSTFSKEFFNTLFEQLQTFRVELEGLHTETGPGVYEAAIAHTDVLEAADRAVLFKSAVKELAYQHEILASFMAKWSTNYPGCSGHIHQSLWNTYNQNAFFDDSGETEISQTMKHYIGGQLHCMPYIMPFYAPTTNSYKRFIAGSWAATSVSWGFENRTTALRVIPSGRQATRLETRVPGADTNPYLSMAASLASGLYGIKHKIDPQIPLTDGNEYKNKKATPLPKTLDEAVSAMKNSDISDRLFGGEFCDHFIKTREWECKQADEEDPLWERKRYFEII